MNIHVAVGTICGLEILLSDGNCIVTFQVIRVTLLTAQLRVSSLECPVKEFFVIEISHQLESLGRVAADTVVTHLGSVGISMTALAVGIGI
jgi:hypothetical protein